MDHKPITLQDIQHIFEAIPEAKIYLRLSRANKQFRLEIQRYNTSIWDGYGDDLDELFAKAIHAVTGVQSLGEKCGRHKGSPPLSKTSY